MATSADLTHTPATELAADLRAKRVSSREIVRAILDRIDELDGQLQAFVTRMDDRAMAMAGAADDALARGEDLGIMHGLPVSIKDLLAIEGVRSTQGSLVYQDSIAMADSPAVARLLREGAVFIGMTNSPEFGMVGWTDNRVFGRTSNPWDTSRTAGGSSGGAGAAIAAGMGPLAVGTDGGGSIRIPASFCGIFGLKPTWNLVAKPGSQGGWPTTSHAGPMTRTVADAALMLDAMAGYEPGVAYSYHRPVASYSEEIAKPIGRLRIAWSPGMGYATVEPEVVKVAEAAALRFAELGCIVEEAAPDWSNLAGPLNPFATISSAETLTGLEDLLEVRRDQMMDYTIRVIDAGRNVTVTDYIRAQQIRAQLWEKLTAFFREYDLLLTPTLAVTAFPHGAPPGRIAGKEVAPFAWSPFTTPFNLTGAPAASLPVGFDSNELPIGLHLVGPAFQDHVVLRAAAAYEEAFPWASQRPPLR
ncbi:MAG: amidase [Dehalococcoidia bacterium]|nr:amidase [Dehalococcoidia bacterium]